VAWLCRRLYVAPAVCCAAPVRASAWLNHACAGAGVTTESELLSPENTVHPNLYTDQLPDVLAVKDAVAA
jgi:hypothetical protein